MKLSYLYPFLQMIVPRTMLATHPEPSSVPESPPNIAPPLFHRDGNNYISYYYYYLGFFLLDVHTAPWLNVAYFLLDVHCASAVHPVVGDQMYEGM